MPDTAYIVLRRTNHVSAGPDKPGGDPHWTWNIENNNVPAKSAEAAIRLACKTADIPDGLYVAVPARSWRPVQVRAEQQVILKLDQPT